MICDFYFLQNYYKIITNLKRKENEQSLEYFFNDYTYHYLKITSQNKL